MKKSEQTAQELEESVANKKWRIFSLLANKFPWNIQIEVWAELHTCDTWIWIRESICGPKWLTFYEFECNWFQFEVKIELIINFDGLMTLVITTWATIIAMLTCEQRIRNHNPNSIWASQNQYYLAAHKQQKQKFSQVF